ncbi:MAG: HAD-IIB family hydrolase [Nitrospiraceae bacterium]
MSASTDPPPVVVFTDLDGCLLDGITYSWEPAREALATLQARHIPLVLVSSKTRAELEAIRSQLQLPHPFVSENGGAVFSPEGYFSISPDEAVQRDDYEVIELGTPYALLRQALRELEQAVGVQLRGFGDMSVEEIAERTGLCEAEVHLARQREYDEPFLIEGPGSLVTEVQREARDRGLTVTHGGRFHHLMGDSDKGRACLHLIERYRRQRPETSQGLMSVALGDSVNDLPMLRVVDHPVLIARSDGSYDPNIQLSNLLRAEGIGPAGWNRAVLAVVQPDQADIAPTSVPKKRRPR